MASRCSTCTTDDREVAADVAEPTSDRPAPTRPGHRHAHRCGAAWHRVRRRPAPCRRDVVACALESEVPVTALASASPPSPSSAPAEHQPPASTALLVADPAEHRSSSTVSPIAVSRVIAPRPSRWRTVPSAAAARSGCTSGPNPDVVAVTSSARSTPSAGAARRARTRRTCAAATARWTANASGVSADTQLSMRSSSSRSCTSTVPDYRRGSPRRTRAPTAGAVPTLSTPRQATLHRTAGSRCRRRAAAGWRGPAPGRAHRCVRPPTTAWPAIRHGGPGGRRAASAVWTAASRSTIAAAASSSSERQAMTVPASTRTTNPSNTCRRAAASVPRTSP